ncbi:ArnT family glycosyltransferase [Oleiagrimonas soli]|uniref:4-amino-4-deoxy-L-arabinose transferase-like glycosyltransferase n=1 Tax=Oleiagrimonas soli TaxID=1543381 RepID=A0A099CTX3_9GAMM|nr:glycosyltransferase family 39 protein [Oleiagrimonas soli]KGI77244.1 hypothetical protein LF63_0111670 [Oleiagrimonas soli]MBB6185567.1 4-amino-4-deoxy-L-arabinose transferase-like glycosyltransferase [Oleiagrimonas soli]
MEKLFSAGGRVWGWRLSLVGVALLAFIVRWYYVGAAVVDHPVRGDAVQYYTYAWNLVHHGVFSKVMPGGAAVVPDDYRDPGYPLFLALWMKWLGGGSIWYAVVLMVQAMLGALTVLFAMLLGRHWLPKPWIVSAGVMMAMWPHSVTIPDFLLTETLFGFFCTLALLVCVRAWKMRSAGWMVLAGLIFGAASLTNAVLLPFGLLVALVLAWRSYAPRRLWAILALATLLLPGLWFVRNATIPTQKTTASSTDRALQNLVQGSWPAYHAAYRASYDGDVHAKKIMASIDGEYELLRSVPKKGLTAIVGRLEEHPWRYLAWYVFEKPRLLWGWSIRVGQGDVYVYPTLHSPFETQPVWHAWKLFCKGLNPLLALAALAGLLVVFAREWKRQSDSSDTENLPALAIAVLLAYVTVVYVMLQAEPRYSIPFRALEVLVAWSALHVLVQWVRAHRYLSWKRGIPDGEGV